MKGSRRAPPSGGHAGMNNCAMRGIATLDEKIAENLGNNVE
jgi:hypothetical protein